VRVVKENVAINVLHSVTVHIDLATVHLKGLLLCSEGYGDFEFIKSLVKAIEIAGKLNMESELKIAHRRRRRRRKKKKDICV
jgi:hypothetical protein